MTEHYYSKSPKVDSAPKTWSYELRERLFTFKTDAGVFSKKEVDFGTKLLIESFQADVAGPILDMGCGYGPIGIVIGSAHPDRVVQMVDINERAVALAKENAALNRIENVQIYESDLFQSVIENQFAAVITNPPIRAGKRVVHDLITAAYDKLVENGSCWIVIQKKQGAPSAIAHLESVFGNATTIARKKGYYIIRSIKVTA